MVKWTNKVLLYFKIIVFKVKHLETIEKCCLDWLFVHGIIYLCMKYSIKHQAKIVEACH